MAALISFPSMLALCALAAALVLPAVVRAQDVTPGPVQVRPQVEPGGLSSEGSQEREPTLELSPLRQVIPQAAGIREIPGVAPRGTEANPANDRPYLGFTTRPAERCYLGGEEYGMEILSVDAGSPAAAAGLRGPSPDSDPRAGTARRQFDLALSSLRAMLDAPGDGDLIVAINDNRVRTQAEINEQIAALKPGDAVYVTVIRPVSEINHETLKVLVHVGRWTGPVASATAAK